MLRTLWTSKSSLIANQEKLDVISNNIANVNTVGYKKVEVGFKDLYMESLDRLGYPVNDKDSIMGTGVKTSNISRNDCQGNLQETNIPTDFAIDGEGYFRIISPQGETYYTRDGSFLLDSLGRIVDKNGNKLDLEFKNGYSENNVKFSNNNFYVNTSGEIFVKNAREFIHVADIKTYTAVGTNAFVSVGDNMYIPSIITNVEETNDRNIYQGLLEGSNVDLSQEFTDMILTQRAFQLGSKGIQTADEMWGMINNIRSR